MSNKIDKLEVVTKPTVLSDGNVYVGVNGTISNEWDSDTFCLDVVTDNYWNFETEIYFMEDKWEKIFTIEQIFEDKEIEQIKSFVKNAIKEIV